MSNELHNKIMNIGRQKTLSHFVNRHEMEAYAKGHQEARHAAAELALGYVPVPVACASVGGELPPLPEPFMELHADVTPVVRAAWVEQMQAYARAAIAHQPPKAALTDEQIKELWREFEDMPIWFFARAIEAATVPNAKLEALELLSKFWLGRYFDSVNQSEADGINAALASAGVPLKGE